MATPVELVGLGGCTGGREGFNEVGGERNEVRGAVVFVCGMGVG
jgi:hypothetical protein